jgi:signal transduction histidine kinase/CheY-like chemotaxis protein
MSSPHANTFVLVIDDEELIRKDIADILAPRPRQSQQNIEDAAAILSGAENLPMPQSSPIPVFSVDQASTGREGVELIRTAVAAGKPYAVIFLDVRMPGWDGLETAMEIRKYDRQAEIIFITAYSDRSIRELLTQAGEHVSYHCKPYTPEEILVQATHAAAEYNRLRKMERLVQAITVLSAENDQDALLTGILKQLTVMTGAKNGVLFKAGAGNGGVLLSLMPLADEIKPSLLHHCGDEIVFSNGILYVPVRPYTAALLTGADYLLHDGRRHQMQLFGQYAEQLLKNIELQKTLILREKLSTLGQAITMITHDLRTPVKSLRMLTDLIRKEGKHNHWIDIMGRYADQASAIFDDFMDFVRDAPVLKRPVNMMQIVAEVAAQAGYLHPEVSVLQQLPQDLTVMGDQSKLKRIIFNLVNNAAEALTTHGINPAVITISATNAELDGSVNLSVSDNGPGIPAHLIDTIFEPFVTTGKNKGTGLGLTIVRQFVTVHGASISVSNNNGAVFMIKGLSTT